MGKGDGKACVNINECTESLQPCDVTAKCVDLLGSYLCECKEGQLKTTAAKPSLVTCEDEQSSSNQLRSSTNEESSSGLVIALSVVGVVVALAIAGIVVFVVLKGRKKQPIVPAALISEPSHIAQPKKIVIPTSKRPKAKVHQAAAAVRPAPAPKPVAQEVKVEVTGPATVSAPAPVTAPEPTGEKLKRAESQESHKAPGSSDEISLGQRVKVNGYQKGVVRYIGPLDSLPLAGLVYIGVELDDPAGSGDGSIGGTRYFTCKGYHSVFTTAQFVTVDNEVSV